MRLLTALVWHIWLWRTRAVQPGAVKAYEAPIRDLPWAQLNFLHTTDVHGWLGGHLQEPSFSADWGDYISFSSHLRAKADADGSDLLVIDTGDRIEGNGIYDGSEPKGKYYYDLYKQQQVDLICVGNHELYKANSSNDELRYTVPNYKNSYIASNLDIIDPDRQTREPLAPRFRKFTTKNQKLRVLSFGFLFDFTGNANNTIVQPVVETVHEGWFKEALKDREVDVIIVIGHVGVRMLEFRTIYKAIRDTHWDTPLLFFGGHVHVRDFAIYDKNAAGIASGRYLETVGFLSVDGIKQERKKTDLVAQDAASIKVSRRYIDNNLYSYHYHTGLNSSTFPIELGKHVTAGIAKARASLGLDRVHACAPKTLYVSRSPFPSDESIFSWLVDQVFPMQFLHAPRVKAGVKALVITNTGAIRFDIFQGPFTKDSEFLVSPFTSGFRYVKDVPASIAARILELLNSKGPLMNVHAATRRQITCGCTMPPPEQLGGLMGQYSSAPHHHQDLSQIRDSSTHELGHAANGEQVPILGHPPATAAHAKLQPGYTTVDDAGADGDDTEHAHIQFYNVPNAVQAPVGGLVLPRDHVEARDVAGDDDDEPVDLVFNAFIQPWVVLGLQYLGLKTTVADTLDYWEGTTLTSVMTDWAEENWKCEAT